jgi:hypothetical protein
VAAAKRHALNVNESDNPQTAAGQAFQAPLKPWKGGFVYLLGFCWRSLQSPNPPKSVMGMHTSLST